MKQLILSFLICISFLPAFSQNELVTPEQKERFRSEIFPESFDDTLMRDAILYYVNEECLKLNLRQLVNRKVLEFAAMDMADFMAAKEITRLADMPARRKIRSRLAEYEVGFHDVDELTYKTAIVKGQTHLTYDEVAQEVAYKLFSRITKDILKNPRYIFIGIAARLDKELKRVYISMTFGNHNISSMKRKELKEFDLPITTTLNLMSYDKKKCKQCDAYNNIYSLRKNIVVEKNEIYFVSDDYKKLRKELLKYPEDGFACDIVMWEQYPCNGKNIVNREVLNKGYMTKPVFVEDFDKLNVYKGRLGQRKLRLYLGEIPAEAKDYEINLMVIKERYVCTNLAPTYDIDVESNCIPEVTAYPDTISKYNKYTFIPKADTAIVRFLIPFESGRAEYSKEDIQAFIDAMNQPNFFPLDFKVTAYSSIEGDPQKNMQLRGQRINSILSALKAYSDNQVPVTTASKDSWDMFYRDIVGTNYQFLKPKSKKEVLEYLKSGNNLEKLEPILAKHRFAEVEIRVRYDISNIYKEQEYVLYQFNKALKEYRDDDALNIQKYIIEQVLAKRYSHLVIDKMKIPDRSAYAGIKMNKLWLHYVSREIPVDAKFLVELEKLHKQSPTNQYIKRNLVYARLMLEQIDGEYYVIEMQEKIDELMTSSLPKYVVDPINLQLQIKSIENVNKTFKVGNTEEFLQQAFDRIKGIIEIDRSDWKGAYNLAILFKQMGDYSYPQELMGSMLYNPNIDEDFVFLYLSVCSHSDYMFQTAIFEDALEIAHSKNPARLCELIRTGKITFQIFDNPNNKKFYCDVCN